jgi:hypothetical protein
MIRSLSPEARAVCDHWRARQNLPKLPHLTPDLVEKLERAVLDLGVELLKDSVAEMALREVRPLIKSIRAGYSKRKIDERDAARGSATRGAAPHGEKDYLASSDPARANAFRRGPTASRNGPLSDTTLADLSTNRRY